MPKFAKNLIKWEKFCAKRARKDAKHQFKLDEVDRGLAQERNDKIIEMMKEMLPALLSTLLPQPSTAASAYSVPAPSETIPAPRLTLTYTQGQELYVALAGCDLPGEGVGVIMEILLKHGVHIHPPSESQPQPEKKNPGVAQA